MIDDIILLQLSGLSSIDIFDLLPKIKLANFPLIQLVRSSINLGIDEDKLTKLRNVTQRQINNEKIAVDNAGKEISFITYLDEDYPQNILRFKNFQPILWYYGNIKIFKMDSIGIGGSRDMSGSGSTAIKNLITGISPLKQNIISGGASGCDYKAHSCADESELNTTLISPEGITRAVDNWYVRKYESNHIGKTGKNNGLLVVSQFLPSTVWKTENAFARNRLIVHGSKEFYTIECKHGKGGSWATGLDALLYKIPLNTFIYKNVPMSAKGNEHLVKLGANGILEDDILSYAKSKINTKKLIMPNFLNNG